MAAKTKKGIGEVLKATLGLLLVLGIPVFGFILMIRDGIPEFTDLFEGRFFEKVIDHEHNMGVFITCLIIALIIAGLSVITITIAKKHGWNKNYPIAFKVFLVSSCILSVPLWLLVLYWLNGIWIGEGSNAIFIVGGFGFYGNSVLGTIIRFLGLLVLTFLFAFFPAFCGFAYIDHKENMRNRK